MATHEIVQITQPTATWKDLTLPDTECKQLKGIAEHLKSERLATKPVGPPGRRSPRAGVIALFAGSSGTAKTLAAEVLANELNHPLHRVDIRRVVSKYIGETEKNLQRLFHTAANAGAVLLFDEADALLGKRSEVTDGHDRFANQQLNYLLQRMEVFPGLSILSSNRTTTIDPALLRRIHVMVTISSLMDKNRKKRSVW